MDLATTPFMKPPDGQLSNFDRSLCGVQLATIIVFGVTYAIATITLAIRYVSSVLVVKSLELDVVLVTLAWGTSMGFFISLCFCMKYGWGCNAWDVSMADMINYNNYLLPTTLTYMWSPTLSKMAILSVLYRIDPSKWYRVAVYAIAGMLLTYTIVFTALLTGPCNARDNGSGKCLNGLAIAQVVLNIFTDVCILALPLPTLMRLQISFRQKMVAISILSLGSAVLIASVVRAPYVRIFATNPNITLKQAEAGIWSIIELNFGIICNNLMRMKPFIKRFMPRLLTFLGFSSYKNSLRSSSKRAGTGEGSGLASWRLGKPPHSYELHSIEKSEPHRPDFEEQYRVPASARVRVKQNESTDSILR